MGNVGSRVADIAVHLAHDTNVFIAIKQRILILALHAHAAGTAAAAIGCFVCLEAGIGQHYDKSLGVLVAGGDGNILFSDELG
jgi:hypothetical protein